MVNKKSKKNIKRDFFEVNAPLTATKIHLYAGAPEDLNGRVVKLDLTKSLRGKSLELKMKVRLEGEKLEAEPISAGLVSSYIRKMMRRGTDYVEDSFEAKCRDVKVRVKPFFITRKRVSRAVRNVLRENAKKFLEGYLKTRTAREIFSEIMANKLQKQLALKLKKIYPLALCEIRMFEVVGELDKKDKAEEENKKIVIEKN